ncbi:unnamed protein product, partial [Ectocarpus fasciculatus]
RWAESGSGCRCRTSPPRRLSELFMREVFADDSITQEEGESAPGSSFTGPWRPLCHLPALPTGPSFCLSEMPAPSTTCS